MTIQSERPQAKRLNRVGMRILTTFWAEHSIRRRASDGSVHDDIADGVIMDKQYFRNGKLIHREKDFNPLMQYSFVVNGELEKTVSCPNCGWKGKGADFTDGCPYCGAYYGISYTDRQAASMRYAEKKAKEPGRFLIPLLLILGACIGISLVIVLGTGRTSGLFDWLKGIAFGAPVGLGLFYVYYLKNIHTITQKMEENYRRQSAMLRSFEEELKKKGISLSRFFTGLNTELAARIFDDASDETREIVDWDILDYNDCRADRADSVDIAMTMRILRLRNGHLHSEEKRVSAALKVNPVQEDSGRGETPSAHCYRCGSAVDLTGRTCGYCGAPIRYKQPLYLTELQL